MEHGYTPNNLKQFMIENDLKAKDVYTHLGKCRSTFENYLRDIYHPKHASMTHANWLKVLELQKNP